MMKEIIEKYLPEFSQKESLKNLGNREFYIGASDVGQCPRKVVLSKFAQPDHSVETLIRFLRGHIAEKVATNALSVTPYHWEEQMEIIHPEYTFIKAHPDVVVRDKNNKKFWIVELKSTAPIPDEPYSSWRQQIYFQIGMLKTQYPDADIQGSVFAVDISKGQYQEFNGFAYDEIVFNSLIEKAKSLYEKLKNVKDTGEENDLETEESVLCIYCPFKKSCPKFTGDELKLPDEVKELVVNYSNLSEALKDIKTKMDAMRTQILDFTGDSYKASFDGLSLSVYTQNSNRVDSKQLQEDYPDIYKAVIKSSKSVVLKVQ